MDPVDNVEVLPSEDNGNVPVDVAEPTPSAEPKPADVPADTKEPAAPAAIEPELFELPDGRKVDAATLSTEWKEKFYPEYTRKSQALAAKEKPLETTPAPNKYADPEYVPQSYEEILQAATERALTTIEEKNQARIREQEAVESAVESQLTEIKKIDANLNENALFQHATKYGFRDLKSAHQNMRDMADTVKKVQAKTVQDVTKRNDPVSVVPGAGGNKPDPSQFSSAREYLKSLAS